MGRGVPRRIGGGEDQLDLAPGLVIQRHAVPELEGPADHLEAGIVDAPGQGGALGIGARDGSDDGAGGVLGHDGSGQGEAGRGLVQIGPRIRLLIRVVLLGRCAVLLVPPGGVAARRLVPVSFPRRGVDRRRRREGRGGRRPLSLAEEVDRIRRRHVHPARRREKQVESRRRDIRRRRVRRRDRRRCEARDRGGRPVLQRRQPRGLGRGACPGAALCARAAVRRPRIQPALHRLVAAIVQRGLPAIVGLAFHLRGEFLFQRLAPLRRVHGTGARNRSRRLVETVAHRILARHPGAEDDENEKKLRTR